MDFGGVEWIARALDFWTWMIGVGWVAVTSLWRQLAALQAEYPQILSLQTLFGLVGSGIAVWKWWEGREGNLFRRFEEMIERNEARLVKACSDLLDVMCRNLDWTNRTTSDLVAISLLVIFTRLNVLRSSPAPSAHR
jgi:hypothetical protein